MLAAVAVLGGFFATVERPGHFVAQKWDSFKTLPARETTSTHLLTLGSNRYDFWRVSADELVRHPLAGIGARGFLNLYLAKGKSTEQPARVHSLPLEVLLEDGIVGFVLLAVALALPLAAAATRTRTRKLPATAAFGAGVCWLAQASVDWTWTFPAVGVPAFLLLGIALSRDEQRSVGLRTALPVAAAFVALAFVAFGATWRSLDLTAEALERPRDVARVELERARRLDPFTVDPLLIEGRIAATPAASLALFEEAARREPRNVAARYCVVVTSVEAGRRDEARRELAALLKLARPDYAFVQDAQRAVAKGSGAPSCRV